ncbi:MAG: hypothetical protein L6R39_001872 [Caloplaca ligustica]|nr:MAG: hypothetical protein L6R39_001872 [Caloplaca ligustica]
MPDTKNSFHGIAFFTNLFSTLCLTTLVALAIFVNQSKYIVGGESTHGYKSIDLDIGSWNIACTVVGTAIGILAAIAFSNLDDVLTRRELVNDRGVAAIFLRPLTVKRGLEQVHALQLPLERTILVIFTIATALMSAAMVALFGVHSTTEEIVNPYSSYPLASLNQSFLYNYRDGGVGGAVMARRSSVTGQLSGFLYKAAYILGLKILSNYNPFLEDGTYLPEQGPLGDTLYNVLNTGGVGLNMSSYLQYSGSPRGFNIPAQYEFNELRAAIYSTQVNVSCQNVTSAYTVSTVSVEQITLAWAAKPDGPNISLFEDRKGPKIEYTLAIGSDVSLDPVTAEPIHTLVIPDFPSALVLECTYSGREYLANVSVALPVSPLVINGKLDEGLLLGPIAKQRVANVTHGLLSVGGQGGNLARGFIDTGYNKDGTNNTDMASALEIVMGQVAEAYYSVLRQQIERSNIYRASLGPSYDSELRLYVTVLRLGGAQYGWLAVPGLLFLGSLIGTCRICASRNAVGFEAQDVVKLLCRLHDDRICETTRLNYTGTLAVVTGRTQKIHQEARHDLSSSPKDP